MNTRALFLVSLMGLGACDNAPPSTQPGEADGRTQADPSAPAASAKPPLTRAQWADKLPDAPKGLHDLTMGYETCALDEEGSLWCYRDPKPDDEIGAWLHPYPGVPKLRSLQSGASRTWCGLSFEGKVVCAPASGSNELRHIESPLSFDTLIGDYAKDSEGHWHYLHATYEPIAKPLPFLDPYTTLLAGPNSLGVVAVGPSESMVFYLYEASGATTSQLESWFRSESTPLPFLDGLDVVSADVDGKLSGCAVTREGAVLCWDEDAKPRPTPHAANGKGRTVTLDDTPPHRGAFCVLTFEQEVVCDWASELEDKPAYTLPFARAQEIASNGYELCGLDEGPGIRCVASGTVEPNFAQVHGLPPVRRLIRPSMHDEGWCALTEAGGLWCWGEPFDISARPGGSSIEGAYMGPTELVAEGVLDFRFGDEARAWCLSTAEGTRCEGEGWSEPQTFAAGVQVGWLHQRGLCTLDGGSVDCKAMTEPLPEVLGRATQGLDVDVFWANRFYGCLAAGTQVRCWHARDEQLFELSAPAELRSLHASIYGACGWLEDGRVACWREGEDETFVPLEDGLKVESFSLSYDGYCGASEQGFACGNPSHHWTRSFPQAAAGFLDNQHPQNGCILDAGGQVYCTGEDDHGQRGQPGGLVALPLREGEAMGALERQLGI